MPVYTQPLSMFNDCHLSGLRNHPSSSKEQNHASVHINQKLPRF
uniref:Uncharacterized protein n=1 Tax=Arundo donax TaxID=35708 RepID=A0A0A9A3X6_ARUDO